MNGIDPETGGSLTAFRQSADGVEKTYLGRDEGIVSQMRRIKSSLPKSLTNMAKSERRLVGIACNSRVIQSMIEAWRALLDLRNNGRISMRSAKSGKAHCKLLKLAEDSFDRPSPLKGEQNAPDRDRRIRSGRPMFQKETIRMDIPCQGGAGRNQSIYHPHHGRFGHIPFIAIPQDAWTWQ